ncbi:MAG: hypothetical protein E2O77_02760 [Caldithrix sp.]|nr:MAG: hypothetical protein E2O77_02760 [Caldithrix sp.]
MAKFFVAVLLSLFTAFVPLQAQVVLSEIMFDALGSDTHDEFVEIINLSESVSIDLSGWQISDGEGTDSIVEFNEGVIIQPGQFGLILDLSYFDNSDTYDALIPEESLVMTIDNTTFGNRGFSNSTAETVSLINSDGEIVSQYTYVLGNDQGFSDEKIDLEGLNSPDNWADTKSSFGTPGAPNSVSLLNFDLAVLPDDINFFPEPVQAGQTLIITSTVRNVGKNSVDQFKLIFFEDFNGNLLADSGEELAPAFEFSATLLPMDSTSFSLQSSNVSPGEHLIFAKIKFESDQDTTNNIASEQFFVGFPARTAVINEIMYSPLSNQPEWIEILNLSFWPINLSKWSVSDSDTGKRVKFGSHSNLAPNGFFVLAEDSSILDFFNPPFGSVSVSRKLPSFNNDFDSVVLYDPSDVIMDRVDYNKDWGGDSGISLEKINPVLASNDSTNWSSSVSIPGGTPGERNSIFTQTLPAEAGLSIAPNPFSPDNDGEKDFTIISYEVPITTASVNIKIYDLRGRLVRFLANNQASGSTNSIVWDGHDDTGRLSRIGIYVVFLQALNAEAGLLSTQKKTVVLAANL